jgi:hypothetical protein
MMDLGYFLEVVFAAEPEIELVAQMALMDVFALPSGDCPTAGRAMKARGTTRSVTPAFDSVLTIRAIFHKSELS